MKEWMEVMRDSEFFNLLAMNTKDINTNDTFEIKTVTGKIAVQYNLLHPITDAQMPNAPNYIAVSDVQSHVTLESTPHNLIPHAAEPAPAQRAGNIAFIWGDRVGGALRPYREDGFPAVILAVGIAKHYQYGKLSRKGQHPAIKAEHLAALWFDKNTDGCYRTNGPSAISFDDYKEFWIDGEFKGNRWSNFHLDWKHRVLNTPEDEDTLGDFLGDIRGTTNLFSDVYFDNEVDELCYMTDFA